MSNFYNFIWFRIRRRWLNALIWSSIWVAFGLIFASLFNTLSKDAQEFERLIETLPKELIGSFNITGDYLSKVEKYISGQFLTLYTLAGGIFALIVGVAEVAGKIDDRTIAQYLTKNISRRSFYLWQSFTNFLYFGISGAIVWTILFLEFKLLATSQAEISTQYFFLAYLSTSLLFYCISLFGQALGVFLDKSKAQAVGAAFVVMMWFLNSLSNIKGYPEYLKPLSLYRLIDIPKLRDEYALDINRTWIIVLLSLCFIILGNWAFKKKDIYL